MPDVATHTRRVEVAGGVLALSWAEVTHTGRRREVNQDAVFTGFPLFVVADGMGGHVGGEIASARTIERLRDVVAAGPVTTKTIEKALAKAVKDIAAHPEATDDGTGTTVTGVYLDDAGDAPHWVTFNIGDSRVYVERDGVIVQITTDHSVVQELVAAGRLSPEEAENHPYGNVITRAVGPSDSVTPDYVRLDVVPGDRFVICSDGLTKELTDYGIRHFLDENADPSDAVQAMLEAALENGGRDNITIVVLDVSDPDAPADVDSSVGGPAEEQTEPSGEVDGSVDEHAAGEDSAGEASAGEASAGENSADEATGDEPTGDGASSSTGGR